MTHFVQEHSVALMAQALKRDKLNGTNVKTKTKKHLVLLLLMMILALVFQLFLRCKIIEVGHYQIKDDRLTLKVYAKHKDSSKWGETRFKSLTGAKVYLERKMSLQTNPQKYFVWYDDM